MDRESLRTALQELDAPAVSLSDAREQVRRRVTRHHRRHAATGGALVIALVALAAQVGGNDGTDPVTVVTSERALRVMLAYDGFVTVVDPATGATERHELDISVGDAPYKLAPLGDDSLVYGGEGVARIDRELRGPSRPLGQALFFLPSAQHDRVWLVDRAEGDPESFVVREVDETGRVVTPPRALPPKAYPRHHGGVGKLVVDLRQGGPAIFDVRTGELGRFGTSAMFVDATERAMVWHDHCDTECHGLWQLDLTDPDAQPTAVVPAAEGAFLGGAIAPDGQSVALASRTDGRSVLVLVAPGRSPIATGAVLSETPNLAWSPDGSTVFYVGPERHRLRAYDVASAAVLPLNVSGIPVVGGTNVFATYVSRVHTSERTPEPAPAASNPTDEERAAGEVHVQRSLDDIRILPPPAGASPKVTRHQAWQKLRLSPGAAANADESWVLLADYSAATPADDPDMDGQDTIPLFQHRLVWVLFQFRVPNEVPLHGPCCPATPRREPEYMDVVTGVDALTGEDIGLTSLGYFS